jgi:hypothetical protein
MHISQIILTGNLPPIKAGQPPLLTISKLFLSGKLSGEEKILMRMKEIPMG